MKYKPIVFDLPECNMAIESVLNLNTLNKILQINLNLRFPLGHISSFGLFFIVYFVGRSLINHHGNGPVDKQAQ